MFWQAANYAMLLVNFAVFFCAVDNLGSSMLKQSFKIVTNNILKYIFIFFKKISYI